MTSPSLHWKAGFELVIDFQAGLSAYKMLRDGVKDPPST